MQFKESAPALVSQESFKAASPLPSSDLAHERTVDESAVLAEGEEKNSLYLIWLTFAAALSGGLFGYDTGVVSGVLVLIGTDLGAPLSDVDKEWITSGLTVGALIGGLLGGIAADRWGRKRVLAVSDCFFIVGAIIQAAAMNLRTLIAGRLVMGFGVGVAAGIAPLFISELAPTSKRGRLVCINVLAITGGQVIAYALGAAFTSVEHGWRALVAIGCAPAIVQLIFMHYMPESPRFLMRHHKTEEATEVVRKIYPYATPEQIDLKIAVIATNVAAIQKVESQLTVRQRINRIFRNGPSRRALIIACGLQAFQQLSGFNSLMYFSSSLFEQVGFKNSTAVSLIVAGTNFVLTCVAFCVIDVIGRRRIMMVSMAGMVMGLALASIAFHFLTKSTGGFLRSGSDYPESWSSVVIVAMVFYVATYAIGLGNVPWLQGELFSIEARGVGTSMATGCNWGGNLIISATYLSLMNAITPTGTFALYAGICFLGFLFVVFLYPETAGLSLEEVAHLFESDFGVRREFSISQRQAAAAQITRPQGLCLSSSFLIKKPAQSLALIVVTHKAAAAPIFRSSTIVRINT